MQWMQVWKTLLQAESRQAWFDKKYYLPEKLLQATSDS